MGLSDVPPEIVLCITDQLHYSWQVNALGQTCRGFHDILNPYLYLFNKKCSRTSVLYHGICKGFHSLVERLLADLVSSNALDAAIFIEGLGIAVRGGQLHMVKLLIRAAADVPELSQWPTILSTSQSQIFWRAASQPNEPIVRLLLEHGVLPTLGPDMYMDLGNVVSRFPSVAMTIIERTRWSNAPGLLSLTDVLQYALRHPSDSTPEIVNRVIKKRADPSALIMYGHSQLCLAVLCRNYKGARCLLENGVSPELDGIHLTPLAIALQANDTETAKMLLEKANTADILARGTEVSTLFCAAAACGSECMVEELLQRGCSPNTIIDLPPGVRINLDNVPAIVWAARHQQEGTTRLLLEHDAKPHPDALKAVLQSVNLPIAQMLLEAGADPASLGQYIPFIHTAVADEDLFRLLVKRGVLHSGERYRREFLNLALKNGRTPQVELLLDRGISFDGRGNTLLCSAVHGGVAMLEFIVRHGYKHHEGAGLEPDTLPLNIAVWKKDFPAFKWLMDNQYCAIPSGSALGNMLLQLFGMFCHFQVHETEQALDMLVSRGADLNTFIDPDLPLVWRVVANKDQAITKAFLDRGLEPILRTGGSPEDVPPEYGSFKSLDLVLQWVVAKYPRSQVKTVLSSMKKRAEQEEQWGDVRHIYRFEDSNGLA